MPFILPVGTPQGLEWVFHHSFDLPPDLDQRVVGPSFLFWLERQVVDLFNELAEEEMDVSKDAVMIEAKASSSLLVDLAVILIANWSEKRAKVKDVITRRLAESLRAQGFTGSVAVHVNLVGSTSRP